MRAVDSADTVVCAPLRVVDVTTVVQPDRCAELRAQLGGELGIHVPARRIALVTAISAKPEVQVRLLAVVALDSRPEIRVPGISHCRTSARITIVVRRREIVVVDAEVRPHEVLPLNVLIDVDANRRGQAFGGPLIHRVEVELGALINFGGLVIAQCKPVTEHHLVRPRLESKIVRLEAG